MRQGIAGGARRGAVTRALVIAAATTTLALALAAAPAALAAPKLQRVTTLGVGPYPSVAAARTPDGGLHLLYRTTAPGSSAPDGLATRAISPSGTLGPAVQALSGWAPGQAGLAFAGGSLQAVFGATSPGANPVGAIWQIASSSGGATWSAPADVSGGTPTGADFDDSVTAQPLSGTVVLTLAAAGQLVAQSGLGQSATRQVATGPGDDFATDGDSALDPGAGEVVASWHSAAGSGGTFLREIAPSLGVAVKVPGQVRGEQVLAGRDAGAGVFTAYTPDGTHVRLLRYGGGSVVVGRVHGVSAETLGVATGIGGRIWVMWGNEAGGLAITRSNRAVTRFEPVQRLNPHAFTLYRLAGDGRLGPLDLLVDQIPRAPGGFGPAGTFYARVLPRLSGKVVVKALKGGKRALHVHVTDAGDAVAGATVAAGGKSATTGKGGSATLVVAGAPGTVAVKAPGYRPLRLSTKT